MQMHLEGHHEDDAVLRSFGPASRSKISSGAICVIYYVTVKGCKTYLSLQTTPIEALDLVTLQLVTEDTSAHSPSPSQQTCSVLFEFHCGDSLCAL
jgi:hypothetical protein